jgi:hypothetical protein
MAWCAPGTTYSSGDNRIMPYTPLIPKPPAFRAISRASYQPQDSDGKTYFFVNYEGFGFPNSTTFERAYPPEAW